MKPLPNAFLALVALLAATSSAAAATQDVIFYLHENLHIVPERHNTREGDVIAAHVINAGQSPHDLLFCGDGVKSTSDCTERWAYTRLEPGQEANITVDIPKAGTFEFYCTIPGHKQGGMVGELIVQSATTQKDDIPLGAISVVGALAGAALFLRRRP